MKDYHRNLTNELSSFDFKDFELLPNVELLLIVVSITTRKREISTGRLSLMDIRSVIV